MEITVHPRGISKPFLSNQPIVSGQRRDSEKRKKEFIVVQSDLWDTNTFQYTCQKSPPAGEGAPGDDFTLIE